MKDLIKRYKTQNTKGIKGIIKVISESISIFKYKIKCLTYEKTSYLHTKSTIT